MPNVNDRSVSGGQPYIAPAPDLPPAKPVAATPVAVDAPVDSLQSPKAPDGAGVQSARKAITKKVSLAARIAKGAAIVGLAVGLVMEVLRADEVESVGVGLDSSVRNYKAP